MIPVFYSIIFGSNLRLASRAVRGEPVFPYLSALRAAESVGQKSEILILVRDGPHTYRQITDCEKSSSSNVFSSFLLISKPFLYRERLLCLYMLRNIRERAACGNSSKTPCRLDALAVCVSDQSYCLYRVRHPCGFSTHKRSSYGPFASKCAGWGNRTPA